ncbi:hypothetical protein TruAng_004899 [Truncatella angustata]|nr:hypothetical protein TruAng_004899 [Truncatella angustata]
MYYRAIRLASSALQTLQTQSQSVSRSLKPQPQFQRIAVISQRFASSKIIEAIKEDHRQLEYYHDRILNGKNDDEKIRYQNAFVWELTRHSIGEELVVYPALEKRLPYGKDMADKDREEHQTVKNLLYEFQKLKPSDSNFQPTLDKLMKNLKQHIEEEEHSDLVELEEALDNTESSELSSKFERTKYLTPTRSHPNAPNKPPFETVVGLMSAPLDKIGDLLRRWPNDASHQSKGDQIEDPNKGFPAGFQVSDLTSNATAKAKEGAETISSKVGDIANKAREMRDISKKVGNKSSPKVGDFASKTGDAVKNVFAGPGEATTGAGKKQGKDKRGHPAAGGPPM